MKRGPGTEAGMKARGRAAAKVRARRTLAGELKRGRQMQDVLNGVLAISLKEAPIEELLEEVLKRILSVKWLALESRGGIWLADGAGGGIVLKAEKILPAALKKTCARVPEGRCLCGRAAASGKIVYAGRVDLRHEF